MVSPDINAKLLSFYMEISLCRSYMHYFVCLLFTRNSFDWFKQALGKLIPQKPPSFQFWIILICLYTYIR